MTGKTKEKRGSHKARFPALLTSHVFPFRDVISFDEARFPALSTSHMLSFRVGTGLQPGRYLQAW